MKNWIELLICISIAFVVQVDVDCQNTQQSAQEFLEKVKAKYAELESLDTEIVYNEFDHYKISGNNIEMRSRMIMDRMENIYLSLFEEGRMDYEFKKEAKNSTGRFRRDNDEFQESFLNSTYRLHGVGRSSFSDIAYLFFPDKRDSLVYQIWTGEFSLSMDSIYYPNDTLIRISFEEIKIRTPKEIEEMRRNTDSIARQYLPVDNLPKRKYASKLEYYTRYYFNNDDYLLVKKEADINDDIGNSKTEEWLYHYTVK